MASAAEFLKLLEHARAHARSGRVNDVLGDYEKALRTITPDDSGYAVAIGMQSKGARAVSQSPTLDLYDSVIRSEMVAVLREQRRFDEAYHHATIALYLDRLLHGEHHNNTAASLHDLGLIQAARHRTAEAFEWFRKADLIDQQLKKQDPDNVQVTWRTLVRASSFAELGYLEQAARSVLELLPNVEQHHPDRLQVADALNSGAQCLQNLGEHNRAKSCLQRAIEIQLQVSPSHPQLARLYSNLSLLLHEQGNFEEAERYGKKAEDLRPHAFEKGRDGRRADQTQLEKWIEASTDDEYPNEVRKSHDIFVSFNTRDENLVHALHDATESLGLSVWTFKELADWETPKEDEVILTTVFSEIDRSRLVLIVASGSSLTSQFVHVEIEHSVMSGVPVLVWYPGGVRIHPQKASKKSDMSPDRLFDVAKRLFRPGVHAFYGFGLRNSEVSEIAAAIVKRFAMFVPRHPRARMWVKSVTGKDILNPTRMWPIFVDDAGKPMFRSLAQ